MRVMLIALVPTRRRTGVGTYVRELVRAWPRAAAPELLVATPDPGAFDFVGSESAVRIVPVGVPGGGPVARTVALHARIPRLAARERVDVLLSPNFLSPLRAGVPGRAVVVQDLAFVHHSSTIPLLRRMYYVALVRASLRGSQVVLTTTQTVAEEVAAFEPSVASRIRIAPLGVPPTHLATDPDPRNRHDGDLLGVGTLEPRKNLGRVLAAHGRLCRRFTWFPALRLVGADGWGTREVAHALAGHPAPAKVVRLGYLTDEELAGEYRRARGLVFCSLYEGFGLPAVEAMSHGCPVLCSRGTALAEVTGTAALTVDPTEIGELEQGMLRLATDAPLRERLGRAGPERAREFTWERCARRTADALDAMATEVAARGR